MFDQTIQRVGFACKFVNPDQSIAPKKLREIEKRYRETTTTVAWLNRQIRDVAVNRLWNIMQHNTASALRLVGFVGALPRGQRMLRLSSDQLPAYTHPDWAWFYRRNDVVDFLSREYAKVGDLARELDVRLSMHPGQFTVLGSDRADVVDRSIEDMEYHAQIAEWMGYGQKFQDFKINIHLSGKLGADGFRDAANRLSLRAQRMMTIENDEFASGLDDILALGDRFALVFDTHHHFIHSNEFVSPNDDRYQRVIDSWRGVRPVIHYSVSREEYMENHAPDVLPNAALLESQGHKRGKLRAHSDMYNHPASNDMVAEFWPYADIMAEAKSKNLASTQLYNYLKEKTQ